MQWRQLIGVFNHNRSDYFQWLFANVGGLLVAYSAIITIWIFHQELGSYQPGPEEFLIIGSISVAVAGVSYLSLPREASGYLNRIFAVFWAFLLAAVYGILISMGVKDPVVSDESIAVVVGLLFILCLGWSSVTWLHERGIKEELAEHVVIPEEPPPGIAAAAETLPKVAPRQQQSGE